MDRRHARLAGAGLATTLVLMACAGDDGEDGAGDGQELMGQGFEECAENPNACNSGERADGGSISWIVERVAEGWATISTEAGTVYTLQALHGVLPHTGQFEPDGATYKHNMDLLVEDPQVINEDPFTTQFQIREEAAWDDGTPITADDFAVYWKMSASEEEGHCVGCTSRSTATFDKIESIEGSDGGKTVTITYKPGQRDPEWFTFGSTHDIAGGIPPAHVAEDQGLDIDDPEQLGRYFEYLHTTMPTYSGGPYRIVEGDLENQIIKEPSPEWYGEMQPTLDTLIVRFLTDQSGWVQAVANDEVQGANPTQPNEDVINQLQDNPDVLLNVSSGPSWEHLDFNLDVPALQDVSLRRAIFTAVDTGNIAERNFGAIYPDYNLRTNHVIPEASPHGDGTLLLDGEQVGPFRLRSTAIPTRTTSTELIQAQLAEIGVEVGLEPTEDLGGMLVGQDYDIAQFGWSGSPLFATDPHQQWHSESGSNFGNYSNPEVDELSEQAANAASQEDAAEYVNEAVEIVLDDAYVMPMYETPVYTFVTDDYINVRDNPAGSIRALYENHTWGLVAE